MTDDLWGDGLDICISACIQNNTKKVVDKVKAPKAQSQSADKQLKSKKVSIEDKIKIIAEKVYKILGHQINRVITIRTKEQLEDYLSKSINTGIVAVDTETNNSTDPMTCKLMGLCLYSPNLKQAYIPVNHTDLLGNRLENQLTELDCKEVLEQYKNNKTFVLMHNAKFDYQVLKCTCKTKLEANWDTLIAANLIDENEDHELKKLYIKYINPDQEKYSIESLFGGIDYNYFPPELFALYAATDSMMTYEIYAYQKAIMDTEEYARIYKLFTDVEMPCVVVTAEMELRGVEVDLDYVQRLSEKYHSQLDDVDAEIATELEKLRPQIDAWRLTVEANEKPEKGGKTKAEQLDDPINLASPVQLAILFYDVLKVDPVNVKKPRGTGDEELTAINKKYNIPLCKLIGKRREVMKLLTTYIDNIPGLVSIWDDHRLRTHFNQVGTKTGRFSSGGDIKYKDKDGNRKVISGVNMQNIPSHAKEIRMMFKAQDGYVLVGNDWSQQEPRLLSFLSNDPSMKGAYKEGKDLYATIATGVYHNTYWDNMEHHEDGSPNPEGKKRRGNCKQVLLGISYGLTVPSMAERMGLTVKEAQKVMDDFYVAFPQVKAWQDKTIADAIKEGYVEDIWGRRRRLPKIQLPKYEVVEIHPKTAFNPFLNCEDKTIESPAVKKFQKMLAEDLKLTGYKQKDSIRDTTERANREGIRIIDNSGTLAHAKNQCVNARIQGSAATMTKKAMIAIYHDETLRKLDFNLLIGVHDELIGECPKENAEQVAKRLCDIMINIVADDVDVPFKSDAEISQCWYYSDYVATVKEEFTDYMKMGLGRDESLRKIYKGHHEWTEQQLNAILIV